MWFDNFKAHLEKCVKGLYNILFLVEYHRNKGFVGILSCF